MPSEGDEDLMRIMAEIERGRQEAREQWRRQQLMIDFVAGAFWIAFGCYILQGAFR
jgi:hypothetical protein